MFARSSAADLVVDFGLSSVITAIGDLDHAVTIPASATVHSIAFMQANKRMVQFKFTLNPTHPTLICITVPADTTVDLEVCRFCTDEHSCLEHTCGSCGLRSFGPVHGAFGEACPV